MAVIIAPKERSAIASILAWTQETFGSKTRQRYGKLIETALAGIAADPDTPGCVQRPEIARDCRVCHLFHARKKVGKPGTRIRNPRHFLLYRVTQAGVAEIGRVLHDSMDLAEHLPKEYRVPGD